MKSGDRTNKLRDMTADDLVNQETEMREQFFKLRLQWAMGQTETLKKLRELRKDRARVKTLIQEKKKDK